MSLLLLRDDRRIDRVEYVAVRQVTDRQSTRRELRRVRKSSFPLKVLEDEGHTNRVLDRNIDIPWLLSEDSCFAVPKSVIWMCISSLSKIFSGFRSLKVENKSEVRWMFPVTKQNGYVCYQMFVLQLIYTELIVY